MKKIIKGYRINEPRFIEVQYYRAINKLMKPVYDAVNTKLKPSITPIKKEREQDLFFDDWSDTLQSIFNDIKILIGLITRDSIIIPITQEVGRKVNEYQGTAFKKMTKNLLNINVFKAEPWLVQHMKQFSKWNVALIKTIPNQYFTKIESIVTNGIQNGLSTKKIQEQIQAATGATKSRSKLIAVDQINKFFGKLQELRQRDLGVEKYEWSTSNDARVRPDHVKRDGKIFKWENPPFDGHPGQAIRCRCVAVPIFEIDGETF